MTLLLQKAWYLRIIQSWILLLLRFKLIQCNMQLCLIKQQKWAKFTRTSEKYRLILLKFTSNCNPSPCNFLSGVSQSPIVTIASICRVLSRRNVVFSLRPLENNRMQKMCFPVFFLFHLLANKTFFLIITIVSNEPSAV